MDQELMLLEIDFLDSYVVLREQLRESGLRQGKSLAINWPYWQEGGFQLKEEELTLYRDYGGMETLETAKGLEIFNRLLSLPYPQVIVTEGERNKIERALGLSKSQLQVIEKLHYAGDIPRR